MKQVLKLGNSNKAKKRKAKKKKNMRNQTGGVIECYFGIFEISAYTTQYCWGIDSYIFHIAVFTYIFKENKGLKLQLELSFKMFSVCNISLFVIIR